MRDETVTGQVRLFRRSTARVRLILDYCDLLLDQCRSCRCDIVRWFLCKRKSKLVTQLQSIGHNLVT